VLLSRLIRFQPAGGVIDAVLGRRASTEAMSTSPPVVVAGRVSVRLVPNELAVVTAPPEGRALRAGAAPETAMPRTSANPRNPTC
jgi:hypothetical protein